MWSTPFRFPIYIFIFIVNISPVLCEGFLHVFINPNVTVVITFLLFSSTVDQSMFENSVAQQQSPQTSRAGQPSARRSTASVNSHLGTSSVDSPSSGGQQRLKNAINLGKAVGAKVSFFLFCIKMMQLLFMSTRRPRCRHHACATATPHWFLTSSVATFKNLP